MKNYQLWQFFKFDYTNWFGSKGIGDEHGLPNKNWYKTTKENAGEYNLYAELLHKSALNNKCYGQSYDDVMDQSSSLTFQAGDAPVITLLPVGAPVPVSPAS